MPSEACTLWSAVRCMLQTGASGGGGVDSGSVAQLPHWQDSEADAASGFRHPNSPTVRPFAEWGSVCLSGRHHALLAPLHFSHSCYEVTSGFAQRASYIMLPAQIGGLDGVKLTTKPRTPHHKNLAARSAAMAGRKSGGGGSAGPRAPRQPPTSPPAPADAAAPAAPEIPDPTDGAASDGAPVASGGSLGQRLPAGYHRSKGIPSSS